MCGVNSSLSKFFIKDEFSNLFLSSCFFFKDDTKLLTGSNEKKMRIFDIENSEKGKYNQYSIKYLINS